MQIASKKEQQQMDDMSLTTVYEKSDRIPEDTGIVLDTGSQDSNTWNDLHTRDMTVNERWAALFTLWHERYRMDSIRPLQILPMLYEVGFPVPQSTEEVFNVPVEVKNARSVLGMLLRKKHRHVHGDLRLIVDRIERGWSNKTTRSTYHLELKDYPRAVGYDQSASSFGIDIGESEEDN